MIYFLAWLFFFLNVVGFMFNVVAKNWPLALFNGMVAMLLVVAVALAN